MKLIYDRETDSLFIAIADRPYLDSEEVIPGIVLDYDHAGNVIGIEIDHASRIGDVERIKDLQLPVG